MAAGRVLSLAWLQLKYLGRLLRNPREASYFWFHLYYAARAADKQLTATIGHGLRTAAIEEVLPGVTAQPFSLRRFQEEYGGVSLAEAQLLAASVALLRPRSLFEFGTFHGTTTLQLAVNAPEGAVVHTLDLPPDHPLRADVETVDLSPRDLGHRFREETPASVEIRQHFGDSAEFDFAPFADACDWIFIDAAHTFDRVLSDSRHALGMLRPGGVVFWHDVIPRFPGTCRAVAELARELPIRRVLGTALAVYRAPAAARPRP